MVVFPFPIERVPILVCVSSLTISFSVSDSTEKVLVGCEIDFGLTLQSVFFEFTFVLGIVAAPNVHAFTVFFGHTVFAMEEVTIGVEYFALAFDVGLLPVGLYFSAIGEGDGTKTLFSAVHKVSFI